MSWIQFLMWMFSIYILYYMTLLAFDHFKAGVSSFSGEDQIQTIGFSTEIITEVIKDLDMIAVKEAELDEIDYFIGEEDSGPASFSMGGVSLKELFDLARSESIEYTRKVSF